MSKLRSQQQFSVIICPLRLCDRLAKVKSNVSKLGSGRLKNSLPATHEGNKAQVVVSETHKPTAADSGLVKGEEYAYIFQPSLYSSPSLRSDTNFS